MILVLNKEKNGDGLDAIIHQLQNLDNGKYLLTIRSIELKTPRESQEQYFAMVDLVRDHTGNDRYSIHEEFKADQGVITTKNFSQEDWLKFIENFKWYVFKNMDLAI